MADDFKISALPLGTEFADDDELPGVDKSDQGTQPTGKTKRFLWSTVKATLKTYFDATYDAAGTALGLVNALAATLGNAAGLNVGTSAGTVAAGDDTRFTNARTPTAHASTHAAVGSDPITIAQSQVTNLTTDLSGKVPTTRTVSAGTGLTGGGDLSVNRSIAADIGTSAGQVAAGDHTHTGLSVQAAGAPSVRALGTSPTEAAAGNHTHLLAAITDFLASVTEANRLAGVTAGTAAASKVLTADANTFLAGLLRLSIGTALTSPSSDLFLGMNLAGNYRAFQFQASGANRFLFDIGNTPQAQFFQSSGNSFVINAAGQIMRAGSGNLDLALIPLNSGSVLVTGGRVKGPDASGTNTAGTKLTLAPGPSTGNATPSVLALQGATVGSTGATVQTLADVLTITNSLTVTLTDDVDLAFGSTAGTKIGTATTQKIGFWNATPVVQQVLATGASHTVDDVITLLQTLGLCRQS